MGPDSIDLSGIHLNMSDPFHLYHQTSLNNQSSTGMYARASDLAGLITDSIERNKEASTFATNPSWPSQVEDLGEGTNQPSPPRVTQVSAYDMDPMQFIHECLPCMMEEADDTSDTPLFQSCAGYASAFFIPMSWQEFHEAHAANM